MKRGRHFRHKAIISYLFMFVIVGGAIALLYFFNGGMTGFVVYNQDSQGEFDLGTYLNTEWNVSAVVLSSGQTSGTYTSKVFDADSDSSWNNISWTSNGIGEMLDNQQGSLMSGNVLLFHLNKDSSYGENNTYVFDFSGNGNNGTLPSTKTISIRVSASSDDAEENKGDGSVGTTSSDLELTLENNDVDQEIGVRFLNLNIPNGATITNAYLEFEVDVQHSEQTDLVIFGENQDNPSTFSTSINDITSRTKTNNYIQWNNVENVAVDGKLQSSNISIIIQEIVNRGGWSSGNAIAFIINGSGWREVESYDGEQSAAPLLVVTYEIVNSIWTSSGKFNGAFEFNGDDDYVDSGNDSSLNPTSQITLSAWVKPSGIDHSGTDLNVIHKYADSARSYVLYINDDAGDNDDWDFKLSSSCDTTDGAVHASNTVDNNIWQHIVATWDGSTMRLYKNNVEIANSSFSGSLCDTATNVWIGDGTYYDAFEGVIDEVAIWNRSLSVQEIENIYKRGVLRLNLTVKSCDDNVCSGESWIDITDTSPQDLSLNNNRYFQYKFLLETDNSLYTPELESVSIDSTFLNSAPTISITEPQNQLYTSNETLSLNFSVTDDNDAIENLTCWYSIDSGANITISNCQNTTFNVSEGSHVLSIYANDTNGLESNDSVNFDVDVTGVSVNISEPAGTKTSRTGISLTYTATGNNLICWYNVKTSLGGEIISNISLVNCSGSSFDVASDGDYVLNLYINNTYGSSDSDNSSFSVDTSSEGTIVVSSGGGGGSSTTIITTNGTNELNVGGLQSILVEQNDIKKISWSIKNTGTNFLNNCKVKGEGGYASWISSDEVKNLAAGEEYDFSFDLSVPEIIEFGKYSLGLSLECQEISETSSFTVEIFEKKIGIEILKIDRDVKDRVRILYLLEGFFEGEQSVELQFLLLGEGNEKIEEITETKFLVGNSKQEFEILIPVEPGLEGELNLLVNLNTGDYSTFVQENIVLGSSISGFAVFEEAIVKDNLFSGLLIVLFLGFAFFIVRRILKHRKRNKR